MPQLLFPTERLTVPARPEEVTDVKAFLDSHPRARVRITAGEWYLISPGDWDRDYICQKLKPSQLMWSFLAK